MATYDVQLKDGRTTRVNADDASTIERHVERVERDRFTIAAKRGASEGEPSPSTMERIVGKVKD